MTREQIKATSSLVLQIKERNGKPINVRVIIATIESFGIRELDVFEDYGFENIESLAEYIFKIFSLKSYNNIKSNHQRIAEAKNFKKIAIAHQLSSRAFILFIKESLSGIANFLPVFIQVISIILFGLSLWTFSEFSNLQSTAAVIGVMIGFISTGGFVQVIGKQISYYWYNENYFMAKHSLTQILKSAVKTILILFIVSFLLNFIFPLYPFEFVIIAFTYALFIGILLLLLAPMYALKQRWMITVSVSSGTALTLFLFFFSSLEVYLIHWLGISFASSMALGYLYYYLKRTVGKQHSTETVEPKVMLSIYRNFNYFLYGFLFFLFVFIDRILAWSSMTGRIHPYILYYEKDYEIGMDLAILFFFLVGGIMEYSISSFNRHIDHYQLTNTYSKFKKFNNLMVKLYLKYMGYFAINVLCIAIILFFIITKPWGYQAGFDESLSELSIEVSILGSLGYIFLSVGVLNTLYVYTLNQSKKPLKALAISFVVNLAVGIFCSRIFGYQYSVYGLLIGSLIFMILSSRSTYRFFKKLDYFYYASY